MGRLTTARWVLVAWVLATLGIRGDAPAGLAFQMFQLVQQDTFVPLRWMAGALLSFEGFSSNPDNNDPVAAVTRAFSLREEAAQLEQELVGGYAAQGHLDPRLAAALAEIQAEQAALKPPVARTLSSQVQESLASEGLGLLAGRWVFPPVNLRFESLPTLLVVSPRHRISRELSITLRADLSLAEMEHLENVTSRLGYSTLVVPIGGLGTYPSMVASSGDVQGTLGTIAHEWAHHFFALRPLGWRYALGIETDDQVASMNETAADIIGREIGRQAYRQHYGPEEEGPPAAEEEANNEFNPIMRETRRAVDALLAEGKVEEAETYMEEQRRRLVDLGYYLRKLNQAYFAFYGTYADLPAFVSPVGEDLKRLRARSASLADFAYRVASMTSYDALRQALAQ